MRIAVIGLGTMGGRIAGALHAAGQTVAGYDIDPAARVAAARTGFAVMEDSEAPWAESDVVLLSLPGPADCLEVSEAISRQPGPVRVVVDLSTVDPQTSRDCAATLERVSVAFLDAPVLGRPASCGAWTLPVGGAPERLTEVLPVLRILAKSATCVGDVGTGSAVKLLNNLMFAAINTVSVQVLDLASRVGLDPSVFYSTVVDSGAATVSPLFREVGRSVLEDDFVPAFSLALLEKDNRLGLQLGHAAGGSLTLNEAVKPLLDEALACGLGGEDTAALIKVIRPADGDVS